MPFKRPGLLAALVAAGFLTAPADSRAGNEADLTVSDFYHQPPTPDLLHSPPRKSEGMARFLDNLLDGRTLPIPCASSLLQELRRHRDALADSTREALRSLSQPPVLDSDGNRPTRDGRYTIHYTVDPESPDAVVTADKDFNGVPDIVDQVEEALALAQGTISERLGWPAPASRIQGEPYDVYLVNLGEGRQGFTPVERENLSTRQDDAFSHMVLDSRLDGNALKAAVAHQYAHASLYELSTRAPAWWAEATAAWLEVQVTGDPSPHREAVARRLERMSSSLASDSLVLSLGNLLWTSLLADRWEGRGEELRQIWLESSLRSGEPLLPLLDEVLRRTGEGTLAEAFQDYTRWALFTGPRDDGNHFRLGGLFPPLVQRVNHQNFPAESASLETVEPLGAAVIRFEGDGKPGGLRIRFEGEVPSLLQVDLVITSSGETHPHLVDMNLDDRGRGEVGIPWRNVREAVMIVRYPALDGTSARFHYVAQLDPLYPFDLSSFGALASPGGITLQWTTARETDLLGWNIYRSDRPSGPFRRLNPLAVPSGSDTVEETDYLYQDTSAQKDHRYYYQVEAITVLGLPERSFVLSARASGDEAVP